MAKNCGKSGVFRLRDQETGKGIEVATNNAVQLQIWISLIFYLLLWRMYAIAKEKASGFLEFLRHFRSRQLLPESQYPKQSSPKLPPGDWLPGFPLIPAQQ